MKTKRSNSKAGKRIADSLDQKVSNTATDLYQKYTDLIIDRLEQGIIPWQQPWSEFGQPCNYLSKKHYRGINLWILVSFNHQIPYYLTFKQAQALGGKVKKGAKAIPICYWNFAFRDKKTGKVIPESQIGLYDLKLVTRSGFLKEYKVFPTEAIEGIDWEIPELNINAEFTGIPACEKVLEEMVSSPNLIHKDPDAYYYPPTDTVNLPDKKLFSSPEGYYATLFHELVHATGNAKRLNREGVTEPTKFGSTAYSKEELIAEMGAGYLNNHTGIIKEKLLDNSVAYLQYWIQILKNDKSILLEAASQAQKSVDYILMECPF